MHLVPHRTAHGVGAVAVTPHELSTAAALEVMGSGGNAIDGAIAANAVQGVVAPETCGVGGDLFALIHLPGVRTPLALNASGRAGSGASAAAMREEGHTEIPTYGWESITVPGCVDGWYALSERLGTRPLDALLAPAMRHARDGFPASTELSRAWTMHRDRLIGEASSGPMFPNGASPERGQRIFRPLLADSLEAVASGRDTFYLDRMAEPVSIATNGWITPDDMAQSQAEWVEPLSIDLFGQTAWTVPPNSQGYLTLAALAVFAAIDAPTDPSDPLFHHALIEAYRAVVVELHDWVVDSGRLAVDPSRLLDPARLSGIATGIDLTTMGAYAPPPRASGGTAYLCTIDADGMGVSLIQSNYHGIGTGRSAGETGVWLHNRGAGFNLIPGHENELMPGHRPRHTLAPTIWTEDDRLSLILGTRGGHQQPQLLAQLAALHMHAGLDLAESQAYPRWTLAEEATPPLRVEDRLDDATTMWLQRVGHTIERSPAFVGGWGPISAIGVDEHGIRTGAADPRVDTALAAAR